MRQGSFLWMLATAATIVLLSEALDLSLGSIMTLSGVVAALMLKAGFSAPLASFGRPPGWSDQRYDNRFYGLYS